MAQIGDLSVGATITLGNGHPCGSSDDWWRSSYLVLWAFNPSATRIPDAHFIYEARYRGAEVVAICPDLNNSAIHADLWINPRPGTDAALALGAAQVIVAETLYDAAYVAEQTDLPLLVRTDTHRFVRESDLRRRLRHGLLRLGRAAQDGGSGARQRRPERLDSAAVTADLDFNGTLSIGNKPVPVRTVFSLLREHLDADYQPEQVPRSPASAPTPSAASPAASPRRLAALILSRGASASSSTPTWRSGRRSSSPRSPATSAAPAAAGAPAASSRPRASPSSACRSSSA